MRNNNDVLNSGLVSGDYASPAYDLRNMVGYSVSVAMSGGLSPVGTLKLQGSVDKADNGVPTTWVDISQPVTSIVAINGDGNTIYNYSNAFYRWVRVVYTRTSGSANMVVTVNSKGF
jgi:hypothetical protein